MTINDHGGNKMINSYQDDNGDYNEWLMILDHEKHIIHCIIFSGLVPVKAYTAARTFWKSETV